MITIIAAMDKNNIIGDSKTGKLPWHIKEELRLFKELTRFHPIVMGRKTAESIGPLPDRLNLVLSKDYNYKLPGFTTVNVDEVEEIATHSDVMICGGAEIYKIFIGVSNRIIISYADIESDGDVKFPMDYLNNQLRWLDTKETIYEGLLFKTIQYNLVGE